VTVAESDVLVIGSGIAGATAALRLSQDRQRQITIITRAQDPIESNTRYAQGGIVTLAPGDSKEQLIKDVLVAGAGLSLPSSARILAEEGPRLVKEVLTGIAGVEFDRAADGGYTYGREAAHSCNRILHVGDATGRAIIQALVARLNARPNVRIVSGSTAVDLITFPHHATDPLTVYDPISCHGAYVFDQNTRSVTRYLAGATILASGGLGRIFRYTSNRFLISEAVRGEGGQLLTPDGRRFMMEYAPKWGDLAPRDVVARAIHHEMIENGYSYVLLDIASIMPRQKIKERFPTIYAHCQAAGIDITRQPIPVAPAAHYACGGVWTDCWGRTTAQNLYAIGEVACTGLHGANRLASTSLLEGLVWGNRSARDIASREDWKMIAPGDAPSWEETGLDEEADPALIWRDIRTIQHTMWHYVGLVRSTRRLARALRDLNHLKEEIDEFYRRTRLNDALIGLRHSVQVALIIAEAAQHNRNSRGCHFRREEES